VALLVGPLLAAASWDNTGMADIARDYLVNRIIWKHSKTMPKAADERRSVGDVGYTFADHTFDGTCLSQPHSDQSGAESSTLSSKNGPHIIGRGLNSECTRESVCKELFADDYKVFGPVDLCFNVVSLVVDIPSTIHGFHEAIDSMLSKVPVSLVELKIYKKIEDGKCKIDGALSTAVHKIMIGFVDVCALALTLKDGSWFHKATAAAKMVVLNNDSGISKPLDEFKELVERHSKIQGTVTLKYVMESKTDLKQLLFIANDMKAKVQNTEKGVNCGF
jgi:hypothetical protein